MYTKDLMEHFMHPRNVGEIKNADGVGESGNIVCGDIMWIYIKIGENEKGEKIIKDIKFKTLGCAAAIATSSKVTELAKNKTIEEALKISKKEIADSLGGLPPIKMHCSVLAADALKEAIFNYLKNNNLPIPEQLKKDHERISKERELIEEKFKDFVESQKKLLSEKM
ncbi:MAG: iron-sulfur cluster assembly scaffold protein [Candidatus Odinarchaeia archaeon]